MVARAPPRRARPDAIELAILSLHGNAMLPPEVERALRVAARTRRKSGAGRGSSRCGDGLVAWLAIDVAICWTGRSRSRRELGVGARAVPPPPRHVLAALSA